VRRKGYEQLLDQQEKSGKKGNIRQTQVSNNKTGEAHKDFHRLRKSDVFGDQKQPKNERRRIREGHKRGWERGGGGGRQGKPSGWGVKTPAGGVGFDG